MDAKEKLINAADKCLIEKGSHAACIKMIAETAGVNHGLIHHYFGSKEGLFIELAARYFETIKPDPNIFLDTEEEVINYLKKSIIPSSKIMLEFRAMSFQMPDLRRQLISMAIELRGSLKNLLNIEEEQAFILMGAVLGMGFNSMLEPSVDIEKHIEIIVSLIFNNRNVDLRLA